jgi:hypothetical protein
VPDTARRVPLDDLILTLVIVLHDRAEADQTGVATSLVAEDEHLAEATGATCIAIVGSAATTAADMALPLAHLVAAQLMKFIETEVFCLVTELEEGFEAVGRLYVASAEGHGTRERGGCGWGAKVVEEVRVSG